METTLAEFITVGVLLIAGAGLGIIGGWLLATRFRDVTPQLPPPSPAEPPPPVAPVRPPGQGSSISQPITQPLEEPLATDSQEIPPWEASRDANRPTEESDPDDESASYDVDEETVQSPAEIPTEEDLEDEEELPPPPPVTRKMAAAKEPSGVVSVLQDLAAAETRNRDIFDDAPFLYHTVDTYGYVVSCNRTEAEVLGYSVDELVGRSVFGLVHPSSEKALREHLKEVRTAPKGLELKLRLIRLDGRPLDMLAHSKPVIGSNGKLLGVRTLLQDMTPKRDRESLLEKATQALAEKNAILAVKTQEILRINRSRGEFISSVSHELRTPLHAVIGYAELLGRGLYGPLNERQQKAVDGIVNRGNDLLALINNILDLSRIEAGRLQLEQTRFNPTEVLEEVIQTAELMQSKNMEDSSDERAFYDDGDEDEDEEGPATVEIRTSFGEAPKEVVGDRGRYKQVVLNLVSNAIRYTERGNVDVICRREAEGAFVTAVSDTGIGIAPEDQDAIFEAFYQVEASSTRFHGGTGLGLSIVRRLTEQMGGQITLLSRLGVGSTFYLHMPEVGPEPAVTEVVAEADLPAETGLRLPQRHAPTVLAVGVEGQGYLGVLEGLRNEGLELTEARNSAEGFDRARSVLPTAIVHLLGAARTNPADLVTLVRGDPVTAHIPIVLVGPASLKSALRELPVDGYVVVPTDGAEVAECVWPLIGHRRHRILLIGARDEGVEGIARYVREQGYAVARAMRGARGITFLDRNTVPLVVACNDMPDISVNDLLNAIEAQDEDERPNLVVIVRSEVTPELQVELGGDRLLALLDPQELAPEEIGRRIVELMQPLRDGDTTLTESVEVR
jgi:PAS domain S-box-containing protein